MLSRRQFGTLAGLSLFGCALFAGRGPAAGANTALASALARIEGEGGGRLGVAILETGTGALIGQRTDERFPLCSTFKLLAAAAILSRVDQGQEDLARRIRFDTSDLVIYSPITKDRAGGEGMTLAELCAAALQYSDNTAGNLLLAALGGPQGVTAYARALGDTVTRLDRTEPTLNEAQPGDPRDTTSPAAMAENMRKLLLGSALSEGARARLAAWLVGNKTGDRRLRAGLPKGWRIGDKTGTGDRGTTNDVAIAWPPDRPALVIAAYLTESSAPAERRDAALAAVGQAVAAAMG